jgi:hypothetical protein
MSVLRCQFPVKAGEIWYTTEVTNGHKVMGFVPM